MPQRAERRPGRQKPCRNCGKAFHCPASRDAGTRHCEKVFCTKACYIEYRRRPDVREAKFWETVSKSEGCWMWTGRLMSAGYGEIRHTRETRVLAHRYSYALANGPIPKGKQVLHKCNVALCVRPEHLYLGTDLENARDRLKAGTYIRGEQMYSAKLTEAQVREIKRDFRARNKRRTNAAELAARYGVGVGTIHCIVRGDSWGHLQ